MRRIIIILSLPVLFMSAIPLKPIDEPNRTMYMQVWIDGCVAGLASLVKAQGVKQQQIPILEIVDACLIIVGPRFEGLVVGELPQV